MNKNRPPQINFQVDDEFKEDLEVLANRRGQNLSTFIRRTLEKELHEESLTQVTD